MKQNFGIYQRKFDFSQWFRPPNLSQVSSQLVKILTENTSLVLSINRILSTGIQGEITTIKTRNKRQLMLIVKKTLLKYVYFRFQKYNCSWKKMREEFQENVLSTEVLCLYNEENMKQLKRKFQYWPLKKLMCATVVIFYSNAG